ncbi:hydantoinase/oxoprolinase family protein [Corynebacterium sp. zg254]|uniref:Hydantoinase/oxoprolinase family protein n=1 Tax=Corynebacterium zhongnanshanii TaxID=2768834 RepID=A0ABQ6VF60_9CORY|nr:MULTISPECIES: hydantoinase/oxoprolinase family protein [Corynebacterium]KAB3523030.1 hydantoinase/oxoprolinase family protein [Corynebacterium zhongnanshanii]MCR5913881.1 hydantoinase/oxoprolinase family protein [Corynebacterium sp. zg254]
MDNLINIDNGGTLTDICVVTKDGIAFTKTLTTPTDLSECFFKGITKASGEVFDEPDLPALLNSTRIIRYSSTQGTNALVERKGPGLGLIVEDEALIEQLSYDEQSTGLFKDLVGERTVVLTKDSGQDELELLNAVNTLTTAGAERLIIAANDPATERSYMKILLKRFPRHLLGSVPVLFSWEFADDRNHVRRIWSAVLNSFLHPTVERFLYSSEHRLRAHKVKNPLLIYRNDGASSRVAKSVALRTYSSGPRGGLEGTRALAEQYGLQHVLMIDVGGTTTDVGSIEDLQIKTDRYGRVEGIESSYSLSDVRSAGVGGSSIIEVKDGKITVGPESVGAAPGPACFGFGGEKATITDVNLLLGILDPSTYLNGELNLDPERSKAVITATVAEPLGISLDEALLEMEKAYAQAVAGAFTPHIKDKDSTALAAFGGGGPMSACLAARIAGVKKVLIPRLAAIFSAYGISFSDVSQTVRVDVTGQSQDSLDSAREELLELAARAMFQEGYSLDDCELDWRTITDNADGTTTENQGADLSGTEGASRVLLELTATYVLEHPVLEGDFRSDGPDAQASSHRSILSAPEQRDDVPVYDLDAQQAQAHAHGPAIIEGPFFTARVPEGWTFTVSDAGDLLLEDVTT